jgi:uncharacterized protein (DUF4415 family)
MATHKKPSSRTTGKATGKQKKRSAAKVTALAASAHAPEGKTRKEQITLRLDADVIDYFRTLGSGYQVKMNNYLGVAMVDAGLRNAADTPGMPWYEESRGHEAMGNRIFRPRKEQITLRVDADTVEYFRSRGKGYQSRMNRFLRLMMVELMRVDEPKNDET